MSYALDLHTPTYVDRPDVTGKLVSPVVTGRIENEKVGAAGSDPDDDQVANADDLRRKLVGSLATATQDSDQLTKEIAAKSEALAAVRGRLQDVIRDLQLDEPGAPKP